jgi:hypothetical protein
LRLTQHLRLGVKQRSDHLVACARGASSRCIVQQRLARTCGRALVWLLTSAVIALDTDEALPAPHSRYVSHLKHAPPHLVERIPFAETRNYLQRVMENLQVYCARFGVSTAARRAQPVPAATVASRDAVLVEAFPQ